MRQNDFWASSSLSMFLSFIINFTTIAATAIATTTATTATDRSSVTQKLLKNFADSSQRGKSPTCHSPLSKKEAYLTTNC